MILWPFSESLSVDYFYLGRRFADYEQAISKYLSLYYGSHTLTWMERELANGWHVAL